MADKVNVVAFETDLGWMAVAEQDRSVLGSTLGWPSAACALEHVLERTSNAAGLRQVSVDQAESFLAELVGRLCAYAEGSWDEFRDVDVALQGRTPFQRSVIAQTRRIGWGSTLSYGQVAAAAGRPGAARAVGNVMRSNTVPVIVPCHRVVHSGGGLGGFTSPQGTALKRRMLDIEAAAIQSAHPG